MTRIKRSHNRIGDDESLKYYAVKVGRKQGIFQSWGACRKQVEGYSGALYKSFSSLNDAKRYLNPESSSPPVLKQGDLKSIKVYVDGSYKASIGNYSYGCVILTDKRQTLSGVGTNRQHTALRNVAGELLGTMKAIEWAYQHHYEEIIIYHDYAGIANWATGEWKARKDETQEYVVFIKKYQKLINIRFEKVTAHSGNLFNDEADRLAKQALETFSNQSKVAGEGQ